MPTFLRPEGGTTPGEVDDRIGGAQGLEGLVGAGHGEVPCLAPTHGTNGRLPQTAEAARQRSSVSGDVATGLTLAQLG